MDLSQLNEIWLLESYSVFQPEAIKNLLEQASNVRILRITGGNDFISRIENICSVISGLIDNLNIRVRDIQCMKLILKFIEHISTVTFQLHDSATDSIRDMIKWLTRKQKNFSLDKCKSIQIKLDEDDSELSKVKTNHKRVKLTHDLDAS